MASTTRTVLCSILAGMAVGAASVVALLPFWPEWKGAFIQQIARPTDPAGKPKSQDAAPAGNGLPVRPPRADLELWVQYQGQPVETIVHTIRAALPPGEDTAPPPVQSLKTLPPPPGSPHFPCFGNRQAASGIDLSPGSGAAGDIAAVDFNGDRFPDVVQVSSGENGMLRLFQNQTGGVFRDVSAAFAIASHPGGIQVLANDFDNDGDLDLFVLRGNRLPNSLLENVDGKTFRDVTESAGLLDFFDSKSAAWIDYDQDGWLDLCVINDNADRNDPRIQLFRNSGDGTFEDLAWDTQMTLAKPADGCGWLDRDRDGYPDLFILSEASAPVVFRSVPAETPADWRFEEITGGTGLEAFPSGGVLLVWNWNNDAFPDLAGGNPLRVFQGSEGGRFEDVTTDLEIPEVKNVLTLASADLDGDGAGELMAGTGRGGANHVFWNRDGDRFREVTAASGLGFTPGAAKFLPADLDLDGDSDLLAMVPPTSGGVFENPGHYDHRWLRLSLEGKTANRFAISARVSLVVRDLDWILRTIELEMTAPGPLEIGLGNAAKIESLKIAWPVRGWPASEYRDLPLDRWIRIREGEPAFETIDIPPPKPAEKGNPENGSGAIRVSG